LTHYAKHIFICTNQKALGKQCCANAGGEPFFDYMKKRVRQLDLHESMPVRVNKAGCLGRCSLGPCMVIYPEGVWYTYRTMEDIDEIIDNYLLGGKPVERLLINQ